MTADRYGDNFVAGFGSSIEKARVDVFSSSRARSHPWSPLDTPVLMDTAKARHDLGWKPQHDALETLRETAAGAREQGMLD